MDKSKVYFIPIDNAYKKKKSLFSLKCVLTHRIYRLLNIFTEEDIVGIKIDTNEKKNKKVINYKYVSLISELLSFENVSSILCDTTDKFINRHTNASKYIIDAFNKGFSFNNTKTPFWVLDGANGNSEVIIELEKQKKENRIFLAGEVRNFNGIICITKPVPHKLSSFEGALYNIGFGLAGTRGKRKQHSMSIPKINTTRCYYCRKCLHQCPTGAIYVKDRHVEINTDRCINCGKCVDVAKYGGITYDFNATPDYFQRNIPKYVKGITQIIKDKMLYCSFLTDIPLLDNKDKIMDIGILVSKDPLAIDIATWDLANQYIGYQNVLPETLFNHASMLEIGNKNYELITVNY